MYNTNFINNNREEKQKNMILIFLVSAMVFGAYLFRLNIILRGDSTFEFASSDFIRFFNSVLSMLAVLSCLLCYNSNKKDELFLIALMYMVFFIDITISNVLNENSTVIREYLAMGTSLIKIIIISIAISSSGKIRNIIVKNKVLSMTLTVTFTSIIAYVEYSTTMPIYMRNYKFILFYNLFIFTIYIIISSAFFAKSMIKREYIYGLIGSSLLMFSTKYVYAIFIEIHKNPEIRLTSVSITYIGFIIFILGLFIELNESIKVNKELDDQRNLFFNIVEENEHANVLICDENYNIKYLNKKARKNGIKIDDIYELRDRGENNIKELYIKEVDFEEVEKNLSQYGHYSKNLHIKELDKIIDFSIQKIGKEDKKYRVVTIKDISEKIKMEKTLLEYENMKKEEDMKSEFFANISHELKTPLNIIYSTMQLLTFSIDKDNFKDIYLKYKNSLDMNCKRMIRLIDNIVDITKLDIGFKVPSFSNYDIVRLVEGITTSTINYANMKDIDVVFDTDIEELYIKCDPDMVERVMLNLLSNAIKFTNPGGNILVYISNDEEYVKIKVKDDGVGIPIALQQKVFDRFVQSDKSFRRENEGSGIGLSIAKTIAELMGGKIRLSSVEKEGTTFELYLPNEKLKENDLKTTTDEHDIDIQRIQLEFSDIYELYDLEIK